MSDNSDREPGKLKAALAKDPAERHVALAVPLRAVERNKRVAASVLAGGFAYRIFLWLLPFALIVGGGLGLANADSTEEAVEGGGLPAAVTNAIGDACAFCELELVVAAGGGSAAPALVRDSRARRRSRSFTRSSGTSRLRNRSPSRRRSPSPAGSARSSPPIALTWWVRDDWPGLFAPVLTIAPSRRCGSGPRSTCRTGTPPGRRSCPGRSWSRSASRCSTR